MDTDRLRQLTDRLLAIGKRDATSLVEKEQHYGRSWMRRGGCGAFFVMCRKWDRLEEQVKRVNHLAQPYDIFAHIQCDTRQEGIIDDIRDLRCYLMLIEEEMMHRGVLSDLLQKGDDFVGVGRDAVAEGSKK